MPRTRKQYEEIRKNKSELLKRTALKLFAEKGFHATSVSEIASAAGVSKGLLYSYYESKEALLAALFSDLIEMVSQLLNPDNDNEITSEEMTVFFDSMVESLENNRNHWILYYQLALQPEVLALMISQIENGTLLVNYNKLLRKYFEDRFEDAEQEMLVFNSIIKGFSTILLFNPGVVTGEQIYSFKARLSEMFIREKKIQ